MRDAILTAVLLAACLGSCPATAQAPAAAEGCGTRGHVEIPLQNRIERALARNPQGWVVRTLLFSSTPSDRMLQLVADGHKVTVLVSYLSSSKDAERSLQCHLKMIQMPRYKPVAGLGDEAYVLAKSHLRLRAGAIELSIDSGDESLATERAVAARVIAVLPKS